MDGKFYIGYTKNLRGRLLQHESGQVTSTKNRIPVILVYYESHVNRLDAKAREKFLKSGQGRKYLDNLFSGFDL